MAAPDDRPALPGDGGAMETILVVDDEPDVRDLARDILEAQGYHTLEARDADEALRAAGAHPDRIPRHWLCRLRLGGERRGEEGHEGGQEGTPLHYSITWSARCSSDWEIVRPSAFAVLRLITSSNLVGCSIGRSPGLAPFRILSTKVAVRRNLSRTLAP